MSDLTVTDILNAYRSGYFPMADRGDADEIYWYDPAVRGQLSIESLHIPKRLQQTVLRFPFEVRIDTDFAAVIDACAHSTHDRPQTWINAGIRDMFVALHKAGHAHSIECWRNGKLAGGLYGLAIGGLFSGESMFSRARDASKIALVHLCARLRKGGFKILDTQFVNDHLKQFGVYEISREHYKAALPAVCAIPADFTLRAGPNLSEQDLVKEYLNNRPVS